MMPNFIILGAAKSGTTALYHYLQQHPQIYLSPIKETEFFAFEGEELNFQGPKDMPRLSITTLEDYQAQFDGVEGETAIGEASPVYLYSSKAPERIHNYLPDAKLIVILRNPVERAYSQFLMFIRDNREPLRDFMQAVDEEETRIAQNWAWGWHYVRVGLYHQQLKRYFERYRREQIKVYLHEELKSNTDGVLRDIFDFLEVDNTFIPNTSVKHNISGIPQNNLIHSWLYKKNLIKELVKPFLSEKLRKDIFRKLKKKQKLHKPELTKEIKQQLLPFFQEDILKLQELIDKDLSGWLV